MFVSRVCSLMERKRILFCQAYGLYIIENWKNKGSFDSIHFDSIYCAQYHYLSRLKYLIQPVRDISASPTRPPTPYHSSTTTVIMSKYSQNSSPTVLTILNFPITIPASLRALVPSLRLLLQCRQWLADMRFRRLHFLQRHWLWSDCMKLVTSTIFLKVVRWFGIVSARERCLVLSSLRAWWITGRREKESERTSRTGTTYNRPKDTQNHDYSGYFSLMMSKCNFRKGWNERTPVTRHALFHAFSCVVNSISIGQITKTPVHHLYHHMIGPHVRSWVRLFIESYYEHYGCLCLKGTGGVFRTASGSTVEPPTRYIDDNQDHPSRISLHLTFTCKQPY